MSEVGELLLDIYREAQWQDGYVTFPAYLLELIHNQVFPDTMKHDYTEKAGA